MLSNRGSSYKFYGLNDIVSYAAVSTVIHNYLCHMCIPYTIKGGRGNELNHLIILGILWFKSSGRIIDPGNCSTSQRNVWVEI